MSGRRAKRQRKSTIWTGTGVQQEATPHRQLAGRARHDRLYAEALATHSHLWQVFVQHLASDTMLDARDGVAADGPGYLDVDTLLGPPMIVCYVCEQPYSPELRRARCPGEPS